MRVLSVLLLVMTVFVCFSGVAFASKPENANAQGSSFVLTQLRAQHAQRKLEAKASVEQAKKAQIESMVVRHKAIPDPAAYDKLEGAVIKAKQAKTKRVEEVRRIAQERASLRKGGLNEVQEMLQVLPPSSGPLGRIWRPIFGDNTLSDQDETVATVIV